MRQSNVIFGTLLLMFVIFITVKGQLPGYLDLFKSKAKSNSSSGSGGSKTSSILDKAKSYAEVAAQLGID